MGFPLLFAIGAAAVGATALYKASKDDDDDYSSGGWSDSSYERRQAEEEAKRAREARERQERIYQLEDKINKDINTAHTQLRSVCLALQSSELFSVDFSDHKDEDELRDLLAHEIDCEDKFDAKNKLINAKTNKNLALLDSCSSDIYIDLTKEGEKISQAYKRCKQSELELKKRHEQMAAALNKLEQNRKSISNAKAS